MRGVRVHHAAKHNEKLPNCVCQRCGDEFHDEDGKRSICDECLPAHRKEQADEKLGEYQKEGKDNPNWDGGKDQFTCTECGTIFEKYSSTPGKKKYCPECADDLVWVDAPPQIVGKENNQYSGGKVMVCCSWCEASMEKRYPHEISDRNFCSTNCQYDWLSFSMEGEKHFNWKEYSTTDSYGKGWSRIRRQALERDRKQCRRCDSPDQKLEVHHIIPVRVFRASDSYMVEHAHFLANVVTLCISCHRDIQTKLPDDMEVPKYMMDRRRDSEVEFHKRIEDS